MYHNCNLLIGRLDEIERNNRMFGLQIEAYI